MKTKKLIPFLASAPIISILLVDCTSTTDQKTKTLIPSDTTTQVALREDREKARREKEEQERIAKKLELQKRISELKGKKYQINKDAQKKIEKLEREKYKYEPAEDEALEESHKELKMLEQKTALRKVKPKMAMKKSMPMRSECLAGAPAGVTYDMAVAPQVSTQFNTEEYDRIFENSFLKVVNEPLSTFSIDVDLCII